MTTTARIPRFARQVAKLVIGLEREGQYLRTQPKATGAIGAPGPGRGKRGIEQEPRLVEAPTLADMGVYRMRKE